MARASNGSMPKPAAFELSKMSLLTSLYKIDADKTATQRVLNIETEFRRRITSHIESLPTKEAKLSKFNTNPFVLMFHCMKQGYKHISQIEKDILPAKVFMSMETSAGRMVESVVLPAYGWENVLSTMHSQDSVLDGRQVRDGKLRLATLKSGPRCLNDEMSANIADDIITNCNEWANQAKVKYIDFAYGVLYGTKKQSNKKDWHILRNLYEKVPAHGGEIIESPNNRWACTFKLNGVTVCVTVRIGVELYQYIALNDTAFVEVTAAIIRACVTPSDNADKSYTFAIVDLPEIISLDIVPTDFNVSILQRSQLEWLFFFASHFCDAMIPTDLTSLL